MHVSPRGSDARDRDLQSRPAAAADMLALIARRAGRPHSLRFFSARADLTPALTALRSVTHTRTLDVTPSKGTTFMSPDVYSTPAMIWDMEWAVRDVILAELQRAGLNEWDSVGAQVTFDHGAATLIGESVELVGMPLRERGRTLLCAMLPHAHAVSA